jgi:pyruvate dehydrogenase (quinone)
MTSGRPSAVLGSSGPGSLHLLNGLYDCDRNGAPVFAMVTHVPSTEIGTDYFQETRPDLIFADCSRYIGYITSPTQMPRLAELALEAAILERGGGMVILPADVGVMEVDGPTVGRPLSKSRPRIRTLDTDLDALAEHIAASSRPMIFGGDGCRMREQKCSNSRDYSTHLSGPSPDVRPVVGPVGSQRSVLQFCLLVVRLEARDEIGRASEAAR